MSPNPSMVSLIERKKSGGELAADEIDAICSGYVAGEIPDYQVAAWLMAVRWQGMTEGETLALTRALVQSGETLEWPVDRPVVDKHSTGGVGDKTSIALVPLLAAAGLTFVKMSGRGLGHTGGTIDKLESIPGFRTSLSTAELRRQVDRIGCALVGQSPALVPADGLLYALRDVTATMDSVPLIASSVMAKKLAGGARAIALDVKFGSGAFMSDPAAAETLARTMVAIGEGAGRRVVAVITPMTQPLGRAVGNVLEVQEAIEVLKGGGPADLRGLVLELGVHLMLLSGVSASGSDARAALERLLASGVGADKFAGLIEAQGGDPRVVGEPQRLPAAPLVVVLPSAEDGWVASVDARAVAETALLMGAGRRRKGDEIDPRTGVRVLVRVGDRVMRGQPIAELHLPGPSAGSLARAAFLAGVRFSDQPVPAETGAGKVIGRGGGVAQQPRDSMTGGSGVEPVSAG
jgi:pyrimidine-nucleoside phosphorylase